MKNDKPIECEGCNTFDVGSILDNSETVATITRTYETEAEAQAALEKFIQKARDVESEPCEIESEIHPIGNGFELNANFKFSCQAEVVIFQLGTRN
ncbi:TPA: YfcZ/YiiS family protein [Mannheimia haemolytica]